MQAQTRHRLTSDEYLAIERAAEYKSEYYNGEMFAMAPVNVRHVSIVTRLIVYLHEGLPHVCRCYASSLRVKVPSAGFYTYPDLIITYGNDQLEDDEQDTLLNPAVIFEVLSKSTEDYDRGDKFALYRGLESLREYVLVSQDKPLIEQFVRQDDDSWLLRVASGMDAVVNLASCDCVLRLADVYEDVELPENVPLRDRLM